MSSNFVVVVVVVVVVGGGGGGGKSVLYDQPTHVGRDSVDCRPLVDCSLADCWPLVVRLLVVSRLSVIR